MSLKKQVTRATEVASTVAKSTFVDYFAQPTEVGFADVGAISIAQVSIAQKGLPCPPKKIP
jgi:hypothetical protein